LNAGLGDDRVTVGLEEGTDGFFVLNAEGGRNPFGATGAAPLAAGAGAGAPSDDDVIDASTSTLPIILFGGPGNDEITGGSAADLIFGDFGRVHFFDETTGELISVLGFGGRGDTISSAIVSAKLAFTPDTLTTDGTQDPLLRNLGGADILRGGPDQDVLIGGAAGDWIDGNGDEDLIFGDNVHLDRQAELFQDFRNPRFRTLLAPSDPGDPREFASIYGSDGEPQVDDSARLDPAGSPVWGDWEITLLDHSKAHEDAGPNAFGDDYIAGGPDRHDLRPARRRHDPRRRLDRERAGRAGSGSGRLRAYARRADPVPDPDRDVEGPLQPRALGRGRERRGRLHRGQRRQGHDLREPGPGRHRGRQLDAVLAR
jgi:Ca2+-binding RTX toxin-like protein